MKRLKLLFGSVSKWTLVLIIFICGCARDYGTQTDMSYMNLKAISLRELQKRIILGADDEITEMKSFYGINRLFGFLWDPVGKDLILFGEADSEKPTLHFDDFVVSLRNVYGLYNIKKGDTIFYSFPSCTIDPDPYIMDLLDKLNSEDSGNNPGLRTRTWEQLCVQPQTVGVFGIPFNSNLASLMVNADYTMKDIANGNIKIDINRDFKSLQQRRKEIVEGAMKNGSEIELRAPMNRFEFTAPNAYFRNSEFLYLLYNQPVVLVTEEQYIAQNSISGTGKADPLAKEFADNFNLRYRDISQVLPIYEALFQSYRIFAIAKAIEESYLVNDTSFFSAIFYQYPLDEIFVPSTLPGRSMVDEVNYSTSDYNYSYYLYSCGGVDLGTKPRRSAVKKMKEKEIMNSIILARPGAEAVEWNAHRLHSNSWILQINSLYHSPKILPIIN